MKIKKLLLILLVINFNVDAKCIGKFINPITELCWSCLFPITIGPIKVNKGLSSSDPDNPNNLICFCPKAMIPVPGVPVGFWEPVRMVDVTRTPYCLVGMGGLCFNNSSKKGTHSITGDRKRAKEHSFYHVHWYIYPVIYWLELLVDFICLDKQQIDLAYLTELDPTWNDDEISAILSPEVFLFANPLAQAACSIDCATASVSYSRDPFFWCAGCQGGIYPFTGSVEDHAGGVQASLLLIQRMTAKMHRQGMARGTCGIHALCGKYVMPVIRKKQYRTQMLYPMAATKKDLGCHPMGKGSVLLEAGREYPWKGEDFVYLIWRKRNCCVL
ncbi:MAG: conjugal transfer pilus assembly protein TraU [Gammaproteobacteria bacterium]